MNKGINKIKLAITNACNLACPYCFVRHGSEMMDWSVAESAINLLLESPGVDKLLSIYGGEPLLNFPLVRRIVPYAQRRALKLKKHLTMNLCTNFLLADSQKISFLRKHGVKVVVSLFGLQEDQDQMRVMAGGKGSYQFILRKLKHYWGELSPEHIGVGFCVTASSAGRLKESWDALFGLGFRHFNIEIIRDFNCWTDRRVQVFADGLADVATEVLWRIMRGDRVYLNLINWDIKYQKLSDPQRTACLFSYDLEVSCHGHMAFSPFLLNSKRAKNHIIGHVSTGLKSFKDCKFSMKARACQTCKESYFQSADMDVGAYKACRLNLDISLQASRLIKARAKNSVVASYIKTIERGICF